MVVQLAMGPHLIGMFNLVLRQLVSRAHNCRSPLGLRLGTVFVARGTIRLAVVPLFVALARPELEGV